MPIGRGVAVPWLSSRGHLDAAVASAPVPALEALADIHAALGSDGSVLAAKRTGRLMPDLLHVPTGCVIEVDEMQHFTTDRMASLDHYPPDLVLGFDTDLYRSLIDRWSAPADRAFAHRTSTDFPETGGRRAQRAYNDALRDLLAPTFTGRPVLRVPAPGRSVMHAVDHLELLIDRYLAA